MIMNSYIGRLSTRKPVMYRRMEMMACTHYIARHWYRPKRSKERFVEITIDPIFTYIDNAIVHYSTLSFSTQSITVRPNQRDQTNQPTKAIIDWCYFSHTKTARPIYSCTKSPPLSTLLYLLFGEKNLSNTRHQLLIHQCQSWTHGIITNNLPTQCRQLHTTIGTIR